jgi:hypothetical protein
LQADATAQSGGTMPTRWRLKGSDVLTLRNARPEASQTLLGHVGENSSLAYGLLLWATAILSLASLGQAGASAADTCCGIAAVVGGLL